MRFTRRPKETDVTPVAMIVGLGNPGPQYAGTRHNVGFDLIEQLAKTHKIPLKTHKHQAQYGSGSVKGVPVVLVKPLTFMNLSGRSVGALAKHYRLQSDQILVVADDLDLETGRVRMRAKGSSGGHNGHKSIIQALGTEEYPRLKIGIGKGEDGIDHVLSRFKPDERTSINDAIAKCVTACELWLTDGIDIAMNRVNSG